MINVLYFIRVLIMYHIIDIRYTLDALLRLWMHY